MDQSTVPEVSAIQEGVIPLLGAQVLATINAELALLENPPETSVTAGLLQLLAVAKGFSKDGLAAIALNLLSHYPSDPVIALHHVLNRVHGISRHGVNVRVSRERKGKLAGCHYSDPPDRRESISSKELTDLRAGMPIEQFASIARKKPASIQKCEAGTHLFSRASFNRIRSRMDMHRQGIDVSHLTLERRR